MKSLFRLLALTLSPLLPLSTALAAEYSNVSLVDGMTNEAFSTPDMYIFKFTPSEETFGLSGKATIKSVSILTDSAAHNWGTTPNWSGAAANWEKYTVTLTEEGTTEPIATLSDYSPWAETGPTIGSSYGTKWQCFTFGSSVSITSGKTYTLKVKTTATSDAGNRRTLLVTTSDYTATSASKYDTTNQEDVVESGKVPLIRLDDRVPIRQDTSWSSLGITATEVTLLVAADATVTFGETDTLSTLTVTGDKALTLEGLENLTVGNLVHEGSAKLALVGELKNATVDVKSGTLRACGDITFNNVTLNFSGAGQLDSHGYPQIAENATLTIYVPVDLDHGKCDDDKYYQGIGGKGSLIKTGKGKFTSRLLYSGTTTISAGTLGVRHDPSSSDATTLTGAISGAGNLQIVDGTVTASGKLEYTGETTIASGATFITSSEWTYSNGTGAVTVNGNLEIQDRSAELQVYRRFDGTGTITVKNTTSTMVFGSASDATTGLTGFTGTLVLEPKAKAIMRNWNDGAYAVSLKSLILGSEASLKFDQKDECSLVVKNLSGSGSFNGGGTFTLASGATIDATDGAVTVSGAVTLPETGTVAVTGLSGKTAGTAVLTANGLKASKFASDDTAKLLSATATALVVVDKPTTVPADVAGTTLQAIVDAAVAQGNTGVTTVTVADGVDPEGAELFSGVVSADDTTATVDYDFGLERMTIKSKGDKKYIVALARVSNGKTGDDGATFVDGVSFKLGETADVNATGPQFTIDEVWSGIEDQEGCRVIAIPFTSDLGTTSFKVNVSK